jgi:hypothetical protein
MKEPVWVLPETDATIKTLALAARDLDEAGYTSWLQENSRKAKKL